MTKHARSKKTPVPVLHKSQAIKLQQVASGRASQSPGQGVRGSLVSAMFENTLLASGPMAADYLGTQSKVISGSDV